ncbi:MAG TPA: ATP-binding protein, partial [Flavitalea sp.]|nr:ATP-binding protein [Flavitalea sp.]
FMRAITHELKTPIAVTKLNLETLLRHQLDEPTRQKLVSMTLQEANRLNTLASNILVSAQLEDQNYQQAKEDLDFSSLVNNCIENYAVRYPVGKFLFEIEPEIDLSGDVLLLQILVNNLIENALKYSPPESPIVCRLTAKKEIIFQVIDNGPGIPDHEKKNIFRKFYRLGNEQTRNAKGTGIGLYLCRKIAQDHHAEIKVRDHHPTGSDFAVIFIRS